MPQITVTIDDDVYWDLQNLPKGLKSKFVNESLKHIIMSKCYDRTGRNHVCPATMHVWARGRWASYTASLDPGQMKLGVEEE